MASLSKGSTPTPTPCPTPEPEAVLIAAPDPEPIEQNLSEEGWEQPSSSFCIGISGAVTVDSGVADLELPSGDCTGVVSSSRSVSSPRQALKMTPPKKHNVAYK